MIKDHRIEKLSRCEIQNRTNFISVGGCNAEEVNIIVSDPSPENDNFIQSISRSYKMKAKETNVMVTNVIE